MTIEQNTVQHSSFPVGHNLKAPNVYNNLHKQNRTSAPYSLANQTHRDSNVFPYMKNASFCTCSLQANTDLTRLDGLKKEGAMLVYSCPVIMYTLYVALYMKTTDTTGTQL